MDNKYGKGVIDKPEDFLKPQAWQHEEISGAFQPATWVEKAPGSFVTYPIRDQGGQSSCVAYALAKQLAVDELVENGIWRNLSPRSIYAYTAVPGGGSYSVAAAKLAVKQGMTLEHLLPTDGLSEADVISDKGYVTDAKQVALVYKPGSFIENVSDFETIASIINGYRLQGIKKVVAVIVIGTNNGTWRSTYPRPPKPGEKPWYHRITVTDFGLIGGKKHLAIDNSWGTTTGLNGQQFLSIDYQPYMYGAIYTLNIADNWQQSAPVAPPAMPKYTWTKDLTLGSTGPDVTALQIALQSVGMFPLSQFVKPTGAYYGVTKNAVQTFQASFGLKVTGVADLPTRLRLNEIFK